MKFNDEMITQTKYIEILSDIANTNLSEEEEVFVALKGAFKEYLFCTQNNVYIIKKGFMTGHTFGNGDFKMPYRNITNVEVEFKFISGYFEVSAGGMQNTRKSYWSNDPNSDPAKQPNAISLNDHATKELFKKASSFILDKITESHHTSFSQTSNNQLSIADEIMKFKELLDQNIISTEEFDKKKAELLS